MIDWFVLRTLIASCPEQTNHSFSYHSALCYPWSIAFYTVKDSCKFMKDFIGDFQAAAFQTAKRP